MAITFNTNNTIVDSDSGFGAFNNGDIIIVQGTTNNNGHYKIQTATAGTLTLYGNALDLTGGSTNLTSETASLNDIGIGVVNYTPSGPNNANKFPARARTALYHNVRMDGTEEFANRIDDYQWLQFERDMDRIDTTSNPHCGEAKHPYGIGMIKGFNTMGAKLITTNDLVNNAFTGVSSPLDTITDPVFTQKTQMNYRCNSFLMASGAMRMQGIDNYGQCGGGHYYSGSYNTDSTGSRYMNLEHSFMWNDILSSGVKWFMKSYENTYLITNDGKLWAMGSNNNNQAGEALTSYNSTSHHKMVPHWVRGASDELVNKQVIDFDASDGEGHYTHCLILTNDHKVYCWGENVAYQCGTTTNDVSDNVAYPKQITGAGFTTKKFVSVHAHGIYGSGCSFAIEEDGTVWCWGGNNKGQLGIGNTTNQSTPQNPTGLPNKPCIGIVGMGGGFTTTQASNHASTFFIMHDHSIWATGSNLDGSLGIGNTNQQTSPVQVTALNDNTSPNTTPYVIKLITTGGESDPSCVAIMSDWTVRTWGYNGNGQLGSGATDALHTPFNPAALNDELWGIVHAFFNQNGDSSVSLYLLRCDGVIFSAGYAGAGANGKGHDETNFRNADYPLRDHWVDSYNSEGYANNYGEGSPIGRNVFTPLSTGRHRNIALTSNTNMNNETAVFYASEGGYILGHGYQTSNYLRTTTANTSNHVSSPQGSLWFNWR